MEDKIDLIFDLLGDWRNLPTYQLERRLDIFFVAYMKEIIEVYNEKHETKIKIDDDYSNFIPEFILRKKGVTKKGKKTNQSNHADYAIINDENGKKKLYLIELKTDNNSIDTYDKEDEKESQFKYYNKAKEDGFKKIIEDIIEIYSNPHCNAREKYKHVLIKLERLGIVTNKGKVGRKQYNTYELNEDVFMGEKAVEIIYIIPNKDDENNKDKIEKIMNLCGDNIIEFNEISCKLKRKDKLTERFCSFLDEIYDLYKKIKQKEKININGD